MFKLFNKLFSNHSNNIPDIFSPKYEEYLLKQYGNADKINNALNKFFDFVGNIFTKTK